LLSNRALRRLRQILSEADYSAAITDQGDADVCLRRSDPASPLRTLLGLFHAGHSVSVPEALRLFESVLLNELIAAGILKLEGDSVVSAYRIAASDGLLFVPDPYTPQHITFVMPAYKALGILTKGFGAVAGHTAVLVALVLVAGLAVGFAAVKMRHAHQVRRRALDNRIIMGQYRRERARIRPRIETNYFKLSGEQLR